MPNIKQLAGKPFVIKLDGRTRKIGEIEQVSINSVRTALSVQVTIKDEEIAGILGAAAEKDPIAEELGLDDAAVAAAIKGSDDAADLHNDTSAWSPTA